MNPRSLALLLLTLVATAFAADKKDDKVKSDLVPPDKRRASVELAQHLTRPPVPEPLPAELAQPFNPAGFDLPDRTETAPPPTVGAAGGGRGDPNSPAVAAPIPGDRELLETLAAKLPTTGYLNFRGEDILTLGGVNRVKLGGRFEVQHNGQTYVLDLVAIDRTTFTLRYRSQEVTRLIKPGKLP